MKKIGIIGGGSIGLLLAGYLCKAGFDVTIYTNTKEQANQLNRDGLTLRSGIEEIVVPVSSTPFSEMSQLNDDCLFVAVKQYHLKHLMDRLPSLLGKVNSLIFIQNGMGHIKYLEELTSCVENIFVAIVEHGALKDNQTVVTHTGIGEMKIGTFRKGEQSQMEVWKGLTAVGFYTAIYKDWFDIMVKKLVVNGVINPLTAIYKVENGNLLTNNYYFQVMRCLFEEISLIYKCTEQDWQLIVDICKKTSRNRSSMLRDIEEGRETEIEAITGVILEKGALHNKKLPLNQFIYHSVKGLEIQRKEEKI